MLSIFRPSLAGINIPHANYYNPRTKDDLNTFYDHVHSISHWYGYQCHTRHYISLIGGGRPHVVLNLESIAPFLLSSQVNINSLTKFKYLDHCPNINLESLNDKYACKMPLEMLKGHLSIKQGLHIAKLHGITKISRRPLSEIEQLLTEHICIGSCKENLTILEVVGRSYLYRRRE